MVIIIAPHIVRLDANETAASPKAEHIQKMNLIDNKDIQDSQNAPKEQ